MAAFEVLVDILILCYIPFIFFSEPDYSVWLNHVLLVLFLLEMGVKSGAYGSRDFLKRDWVNVVDTMCLVVNVTAIALLDIMRYTTDTSYDSPREQRNLNGNNNSNPINDNILRSNTNTIRSQANTTDTSNIEGLSDAERVAQLLLCIRIVRSIRLLRVLKRFSLSLHSAVEVLPLALPILAIVTLAFFSLAMLGTELFGGLLTPDNALVAASAYGVHGYYDINFDDPFRAALALFSMCFSKAGIIIEGCTAAVQSQWPIAYFTFVYVLINLVLFNILFALLIQGFLGSFTRESLRRRGGGGAAGGCLLLSSNMLVHRVNAALIHISADIDTRSICSSLTPPSSSLSSFLPFVSWCMGCEATEDENSRRTAGVVPRDAGDTGNGDEDGYDDDDDGGGGAEEQGEWAERDRAHFSSSSSSSSPWWSLWGATMMMMIQKKESSSGLSMSSSSSRSSRSSSTSSYGGQRYFKHHNNSADENGTVGKKEEEEGGGGGGERERKIKGM